MQPIKLASNEQQALTNLHHQHRDATPPHTAKTRMPVGHPLACMHGRSNCSAATATKQPPSYTRSHQHHHHSAAHDRLCCFISGVKPPLANTAAALANDSVACSSLHSLSCRFHAQQRQHADGILLLACHQVDKRQPRQASMQLSVAAYMQVAKSTSGLRPSPQQHHTPQLQHGSTKQPNVAGAGAHFPQATPQQRPTAMLAHHSKACYCASSHYSHQAMCTSAPGTRTFSVQQLIQGVLQDPHPKTVTQSRLSYARCISRRHPSTKSPRHPHCQL